MEKEKNSEKIMRQIDNGEITINEARKFFGLSPVDGCDVLLTKVQCDSAAEPRKDVV